MDKIRTIEGITEYRFPNGLQLLLIPDPSKPTVTVNMTVMVGSRHEGYGEAGLAHLVEHMLFKGTTNYLDIPQLLKQRGASFNGTTWFDRTNYYESLPATNARQAAENLEFVLKLEADRLVRSLMRAQDLALEVTVVRNEFERGENNSRRILTQRMQALAYDWHNYGHTTIGNLSDILRVPVEKVQEFYRKHYRPDNVTLVIAGRFEQDNALASVADSFGRLSSPEVALDKRYTTEPAQDGERTVVLRRVGNIQYVSAVYHVPCGINREYAAVEMLAYIFGAEPAGRLYQALVIPDLAASVSTSSYALHDPGFARFDAQLPLGKSIDQTAQRLLECVETVSNRPISQEELTRAKNQFLKSRRLRANNTTEVAIEISEWAAQGDWRLYFLFRDYVDSLCPDECTQAAAKFLTRNNRTLGLFIPSSSEPTLTMPERPDLDQLFENFHSSVAWHNGEQLDPHPTVIESRTMRRQLSSGLQAALLPKRTRGETIHIELNLRFGDQDSLQGQDDAADFLAELISRGTIARDYQALQDHLDQLQAEIRCHSTSGLLNLSIEAARGNLWPVIELAAEMLRYPRLDVTEFELLRRQAIAATEAKLTEPNVLAMVQLRRTLAPYLETDVRYIPNLEERLSRYRQLNIDRIRRLHEELLGGQHVEISAVGDFDAEPLLEKFDGLMADWRTAFRFERVSQPAQDQVGGSFQQICTPGKANAVYYAGQHFKLREDAEDLPALKIGNYILGGSALSSRLGNRIRQQEGISYSVGSSLTAHPIDQRTTLTIHAIFNPQQLGRLQSAIVDELNRLLEQGITEQELEAAKDGFLQAQQLNRAQESHIADLLAHSLFAKRDLRFWTQFEATIAALTVDQVNQALRTYLAPDRLIVVTAGDF